MDSNRLESLLGKRASDAGSRSPACPDEHQVAAYVDGGLEATQRRQLERHLADCTHCLDLVGLLCRERSHEVTEPGRTRRAIRRAMRRDARSGRPRRFAPRWAAAAAVLLAVPVVLQLSRLDGGDAGPGGPLPPTTRGPTAGSPPLEVRQQPAATPSEARRPSFRWTAMPGSPYYDVRILTEAGEVIVRDRVTGTTWRTPAQPALQRGAVYFVHVDAYPGGDRPVSSPHVAFVVPE